MIFAQNEKPICCKVQWCTAQPAHTFECLCSVHSSEPWKKNRPNLYQVLAFIGECVVTFASRKDENFTQYRFFKFTIVVADAISTYTMRQTHWMEPFIFTEFQAEHCVPNVISFLFFIDNCFNVSVRVQLNRSFIDNETEKRRKKNAHKVQHTFGNECYCAI